MSNLYHIQTLQTNGWARFTTRPLPDKIAAEKHIDFMVEMGCDREIARLERYTAEEQKKDLLDNYPVSARKLLEKLTFKMSVAKLKETLENLR
jgi:hypothetical protein